MSTERERLLARARLLEQAREIEARNGNGPQMEPQESNLAESILSSAGTIGKTVGGAALDVAGRVLDYPGGLARTVAAQGLSGAQALTGTGKYVVTNDDVKNAFVGKAPHWSEYAGRMEPTYLDKKFAEAVGPDVNNAVGKVGGFASDVALDPLTAMAAIPSASQGLINRMMSKIHNVAPAQGSVGPSLANKMWSKIHNVEAAAPTPILSPGMTSMNHVYDAGQKMKDSGRKMYNSGFKNVDRRLVEEGVDPLSNLLWNNRIKGSAEGVESQVQALKDQLNRQRVDIGRQGTNLGVTVDPVAASKSANNYLNNVTQRNPLADQDKVNGLKQWVSKLYTPEQEAQRKAIADYANKRSEYLQNLLAYRKDRAAYRKGTGAAGMDETQPVLSGLVDDLQRVNQKPNLVELQGKPASTMSVPEPAPVNQLSFGLEANHAPIVQGPTPSAVEMAGGRQVIPQATSIRPLDNLVLPREGGAGGGLDQLNKAIDAIDSESRILSAGKQTEFSAGQLEKLNNQRQALIQQVEATHARPSNQQAYLDQRFTDVLAREGTQQAAEGLNIVPRTNTWEMMPSMELQAGQTRMVLPPVRPRAPVMSEVPLKQLPVEQAMTMKTDLRKSLPSSAYDASGVGYLSNEGQQTAKSLSGGLQDEIANALNKAKPGLGDELNVGNKKLQTIIEAEHPLALEARKEIRVNNITPVDTAIAATHPMTAALKKAGDASKTMRFRTQGGMGLYDFGGSMPVEGLDAILNNPLLRQEFIRTQSSPYDKMPKKAYK